MSRTRFLAELRWRRFEEEPKVGLLKLTLCKGMYNMFKGWMPNSTFLFLLEMESKTE